MFVSVSVAVVRRDRRWLVAKRPAGVHLGGLWEFPGGKQNPRESATEAALRELFEECGVRATAVRVAPSFQWRYADRTVELTPVICEWVAEEATPHASDECHWVTLDALRALDMPPASQRIIDWLAEETPQFEA